MAKRQTSDLAVGALFSLALVVLAVAVLAVGGESRLFAEKASYTIVFPSAEGLVVGSPVKMAGVVVGTVTAIQLAADPAHPGIRVEVGIDEVFTARVRRDSRAALRILQILSGEKSVEVTPGSASSPQLEEGAEIPVDQPQALLEQAAVTAENLNQIMVSLRNILGTLERGEGLIGKMLKDPDFGAEGLAALRGALENVEELTARLRRGEGLAGRMLTDPELGRRADDLAAALGNVAEVLRSVRRDEGALGALLTEGGSGEQAIEDLRVSAAALRRVSARLDEGHGLLGRVLNDEAYSERLAANLERASANAAEILEKINRGQGTLGALVNERTLHTGLENVVAGVNDSKFARWLLRRYREKGIELGEEQAAQDAADPEQPHEP